MLDRYLCPTVKSIVDFLTQGSHHFGEKEKKWFYKRRGKLSPHFVGSFEILERIGPVAYRLALLPSLSTVHDVFHVSMLRKYVSDLSHILDYEPLEIDENLSYTEQPVEVLAREVKMLRNREIPLVKILWRNHKVEEATWGEKMT
ncbi:pol protein [Cucumis melo var. makuwa]|uniref:Pol protein n=1 Tax=Cucumis melo var. makuwa TaxID=1194695 RepID=A0A5D3DFQ6_CUCMM|nr:pol protein [Cucumis melo var. makuwa]TYK22426.1 pol protein [Cucumis melo var. makuwa]